MHTCNFSCLTVWQWVFEYSSVHSTSLRRCRCFFCCSTNISKKISQRPTHGSTSKFTWTLWKRSNCPTTNTQHQYTNNHQIHLTIMSRRTAIGLDLLIYFTFLHVYFFELNFLSVYDINFERLWYIFWENFWAFIINRNTLLRFQLFYFTIVGSINAPGLIIWNRRITQKFAHLLDSSRWHFLININKRKRRRRWWNGLLA